MKLRNIHARVRESDLYTGSRVKKYGMGKTAAYFIAAVISDVRISAIFPRGAAGIVRIILIIFSSVCVITQYGSDHVSDFNTRHRQLMLVTGIYGAFLLYQLNYLLLCDLAYAVVKYGAGLNVGHPPFNALSVILSVITVRVGYRKAHRVEVTSYSLKVKNHATAGSDDRAAAKSGNSVGEKAENITAARPVNCTAVESVRIVQISDLHAGVVVRGKEIQRIVDRVNSCRPDLVVVTGDIVNHGSVDECGDPEKIAGILRGIQAPLGVYSVCGNHDPSPEDPEFTDFLKKCGFRQIDNRCETIALPDGGRVCLIGRTGIVSRNFRRTPIRDLMPSECGAASQDSRPETGSEAESFSVNAPVIVLDHDPGGIPEAAKAGADLVLCGHTHAGQFFPCDLFTRYYYGKKYTYGVSLTGKTWGIVSSGAGFFQTPIRIGTKSEIVLINLKLG